MKWERRIVLGDVADISLGKMLDQKKNKGTYQPYLANINVRWGEFDLENLPQMRFMENETDRYDLRYGDILVCEGGEPGRCALWKEQIPNMKYQKALHRVRVNDEFADCRWVFYRLLYAGFRGEFEQYFSGTTTIKHMPNEKIKKFAFLLPPLPTQHRIASILSAYDDLIENNRKQIKLLEEAAQRLYKEWFVDFKFPGHENVKMVDGVPEGWERYPYSEKVSIMSGGTPKTSNSNFYNGCIPFYTPKDYNGHFWTLETLIHISEDGLNHCNSKLYPKGTIIVTARGTVGKITILAVPMAMNQSCYALKCDELGLPYYLFFSLKEEVEKLKVMANGGVFDTIITKTFDNIKISFPSNDIAKKFENKVSPIMQLLEYNMLKGSFIKEARDRLLPKLMSGEIEV